MVNQNQHNKIAVYVISLRRAKLRRSFVKTQLKRCGIDDYTIIDAVDADEMGSEWMQKQVDPERLVRPLKDGEIGCSLSHRKAYERFAKDFEQTGVTYAVILEDDALLSPNFKEVIQECTRYLNSERLILLSASVHRDERFNAIAALAGNTQLLRASKEFNHIYTSAAYVIHIDVARKLMTGLEKITDVMDSWKYYVLQGFYKELLVTFPYAVTQEVFASTRGRNSFVQKILNLIIAYRIPILYSYIRKRRNAIENNRLKYIIIN